MYYDANTGIYYYYDAESGRYQFHSRIEMPAQTAAESYQDGNTAEKRSWKLKKVVKKTSHQDDKVRDNYCSSCVCMAWIHSIIAH